MRFITWLFDSPTPIVAIISAIIAYLAYNHQRRLNKKKRALEIAKDYSERFIPRIRYINSILESIGAMQYTGEFANASEFTEQELSTFLQNKGFSIEEFKKLFEGIDYSILNKAFTYSGCNIYICGIHNNLTKIFKINKENLNDATYKFVLDFLNDLEAVACEFYYNVAEEELVYPIMHQTYLTNMKSWYFFIANQNHLDQDRYFPYVIWLYKKWNNRKIRKKILSKTL